MQWYYWIVVLGVLVIFYVLLNNRQKRQIKQQEQMVDSLKVGDKVITHIGIFGKIKRIYNTTYGKICVLEVGVNNKVDIEIDIRYIAGLDEKTIAPQPPKEEKIEEKKGENPEETSHKTEK